MSRDENIQAVFDLKAGYTLGLADIEILKKVARMALTAMDGEPVVFTDERNLHHIAMGRETSLIWGKQNSEAGDIPLYRHVQPALDGEPVAWKWRLVDLATGDPGEWRVTLAPSLPGKGIGYRTEAIPLYRHAQQPVVPATIPCSVELKPGLIIGKGCKTETLLTALRRRADYNADIDAMTPEERAELDASIKAFKAMLAAAAQEVMKDEANNLSPK